MKTIKLRGKGCVRLKAEAKSNVEPLHIDSCYLFLSRTAKKGMVITTNMLVTIVFVVIAALIIFFLWGSFAAEAGRPSSIIFYNFLDWIVSFIS